MQRGRGVRGHVRSFVRGLGWLLCVLMVSGAAGAASASADSFSWSAPIGLDRTGGPQNNLTALDCPTATQCTAGDINGQEVTFDPGSPSSSPPGPAAVSWGSSGG
jgi:hypothetical protein